MKNIYFILICIIIILVFIYSTSWPGANLYQPVVNTNNNNWTIKAMQQTIDIFSANCSGFPNIIKFRIRNTGIDIESGKLYAALDGKAINTTPDIRTYFLEAGNISTEFSYNDTRNNAKTILTIGFPAGEISQDLICS